jgi:hypothetical protein
MFSKRVYKYKVATAAAAPPQTYVAYAGQLGLLLNGGISLAVARL